MLAQPTSRATYHRALGSGDLNSQNERELRCSEGSGMLIGDPHGEGRAYHCRPSREAATIVAIYLQPSRGEAHSRQGLREIAT